MSIPDLVPKKLSLYLLLSLLCIGSILGLVGLHYIMPVCAQFLGVEQITAMNFRIGGNLSEWFSSNLWTFSSMACLFAFLIGRFQEKKHNYSSDIWIWGAFACLYLSVDSVCRIRDLISDIAVKLSGTVIYGNGQVWWIAIYTVIFGMIGSRLLVEMRHYLPSCNAFFFGSVCHILFVCIHLQLLKIPETPQAPEYELMLQSGLEMFGNMFLFFSFALYVRHLSILAKKSEKLLIDSNGFAKTLAFGESTTTTKTKTTGTKKRKSRNQDVQIVHPSHQTTRPARQSLMKPVEEEEESEFEWFDEDAADRFEYKQEYEDEEYEEDDSDNEEEEFDFEEEELPRRTSQKSGHSRFRSARKTRSRTHG